MNTQDENQDTAQTSARTPFPEPRTIPTKWDTSEFSSGSKADSVEEEDDSVES